MFHEERKNDSEGRAMNHRGLIPDPGADEFPHFEIA